MLSSLFLQYAVPSLSLSTVLPLITPSLDLCSQVSVDLELAQRVLVHPAAYLHDLVPLRLVLLLRPSLEPGLQLLTGEGIVCNRDSVAW